MLKKLSMVIMVLTGALLIQCSNKSTEPPRPNVRELKPTEKNLVESSNKFGLKLFKEIVRQEGDKNIFVSPLSVAMALGMTYNGARGATQEAMQNTLELQGMTLDDVNQSYRSLIDLLMQLDPQVKFRIANSIWHEQTFEVEKSFIDLNQTYFDAVVRALDFKNPRSVATINSWVNDNTNGKITKIVDRIPESTVMYLINAIYFKGLWHTKFDRKKTTVGQFHLLDGTVGACTTMVLKDEKFFYFSTTDFAAIDLLYSNGDYSMTILLPNRDKSLDNVMEQMKDENWQQLMSQFLQVPVDLYLPRFKLEYGLTLNDVLTALGMGVAFTDLADFGGINPNVPLAITEVKHKTYVAVDEDGTEAAAATSVEVGPTGMPGHAQFVVDRPFVFAIREHKSGTILFIGKIIDPVWNSN